MIQLVSSSDQWCHPMFEFGAGLAHLVGPSSISKNPERPLSRDGAAEDIYMAEVEDQHHRVQLLENENNMLKSDIARLRMSVGQLEQTLQMMTVARTSVIKSNADWSMLPEAESSAYSVRTAVMLPIDYLKVESKDLRTRLHELDEALKRVASSYDCVDSQLTQRALKLGCSTPCRITDENPDSLVECVRSLNLEIRKASLSLARSLFSLLRSIQSNGGVVHGPHEAPSIPKGIEAQLYVSQKVLQACLAS